VNISLCIATFRRPERLAALLDDLVLQVLAPRQVVVVDNDAAGSARAIVEGRRLRGVPFLLVYEIQPLQNISLTRNRSVALAAGDWLGFVDDDERVPPGWLAALAGAALGPGVDGVLGPVEPVVPIDAPAWILRGGFYRWVRLPTGTVVPPNRLRFGNVLLRASRLSAMTAPFDVAYGLTGGEDGDLLTRLVQQGACIVWCDEAEIFEPVETARLSLRWLLLRALRGGQDFARHWQAGRYGPVYASGRAKFLLRALAQCWLAGILALLCWPFGRHFAVQWLLRAAGNAGKLSLLLGWHYREYAGTPP
jgi:succinoglycan biosynthesis protein ExoM